MREQILTELLGRAFTHGEGAPIAPFLAPECTYHSDASGQDLQSAREILAYMEEAYEDLGPDTRYTGRVREVRELLREGVTREALETALGGALNPFALLLSRFGDCLQSVVLTSLNEAGEVRRILLSRNTAWFSLNYYQESVPWSEPRLCRETVYEKGGLRLERLWCWKVHSVSKDWEARLLRAQIGPRGGYTLLTLEGRRMTGMDFDWVGEFSEGLAPVHVPGGDYGYVNDSMELVISPRYDYAGDFEFGYALAARENRERYLDKSGREIPLLSPITGRSYQDYGRFSEGLCRVSTLKLDWGDLAYYSAHQDLAGVWGYLNEEGREVIPPQYIYAGDFTDGIALVCKGEWTQDPRWDSEESQGLYWTETELWGGIDPSGREVIPFRFADIRAFHDTAEFYMARAAGSEEWLWGIIDRRGSWLVEPVFRDVDFRFRDGLFFFYSQNIWTEDEGELLMGIYDLTNRRVLLEPQFLEADFRADGRIWVRLYDPGLGREIEKLLDRDGREIFPSVYSSIDTERNYWEVAVEDESGIRRGLLDREGETLLPCVFRAVRGGISYPLRRVVFEEGDKKGLRDFEGNVRIPPIYSDIRLSSRPLAEVCAGKRKMWGLLTLEGEIVLPPVYREITQCGDGTYFLCSRAGESEMFLLTEGV